jgi:hypothetical protein
MQDKLNKLIEDLEQWQRVNVEEMRSLEMSCGTNFQYGEAFGISRTLKTVLKDLKELQLVSR